MDRRLAVGCSIAALTLFGFFVFPGHTYLQSDTQIYVPMLEHLWDPSTYPGDLVAAKPHLSYTLYDEIAIGLRWLTRSSFEGVLIAQQLLFRALQICGIYLLARAFPFSREWAMLIAGVCSLGAVIAGPAVLSIEYEPVPRGFAIGLVILGIGLAAQGRMLPASTAGSVAFLYHAPTTIPFWIVFGLMVLWRREFRALAPLGGAIVILFLASRLQAGVSERQALFFRIDPEFEHLQRMRASYNWVSTWIGGLAWHYVAYWLLGLVAFWRVRPRAGREWLLGLPLIGMLSVPVSFLLLEKLKWGLIPQFQPARALLFVTVFTSVLGTAAALKARRLWESVLWFALVLVIPAQGRSVRLPHLEDQGVQDLTRFVSEQTPKDATLLFGDAGRALYPGIVRARALRSVYVDWKSGGQVNYYRSLGEEWWTRWRSTNGLEFRPEEWNRLPSPGIDYLILSNAAPALDRASVYRNSRFAMYRISP